jgi:hypothetical protein
VISRAVVGLWEVKADLFPLSGECRWRGIVSGLIEIFGRVVVKVESLLDLKAGGKMGRLTSYVMAR